MSVNVEIFSGFLGAGKTKLIKKLIEEGYYDDKIAIIENEFGEVSIDGEILKRTNTLVKEINAGCICCQVTGDFKESIKDVVENCKIDRLLVEPTGVAKLSDLKETFEEDDMKAIAKIEKIITVVDAEKFNLYICNFKNFFVNQIKNAEIIILSRTQNISKYELMKVEEEIKKLNSKAKVITENWNTVKAIELLPKNLKLKEDINNYEKVISNIEHNKNDNSEKKGIFSKLTLGSKNKAKIEKVKHEVFETFALTINRNISKDELISKFNFMKGSPEFGEIVRAKGIVNTTKGKEQFDFTLSEINMEEIKYRGDGIISFIGTNLNREKITDFFK